MGDQEKTIDKVLKLLAKAESTTPEEAEILIAKATDLMVRAEIDEAMLAHATGKQVDEIIEKKITFKGVYSEAQRSLFFSVGNAFGFKALQLNLGGSDRRGTWVGFKHDIEQAEVLLTSLLIQQQRAMQAWVKANPFESWMSSFDKFAAKRSHMLGFATGAQTVIANARRETTTTVQAERAETNSSDTTSVALVMLSKEAQVQDWYDTRYGKLKKARGGRLSGNGAAHRAGHQAGRNADIGSSRLGARKALGR